jgi:hypothetical protein
MKEKTGLMWASELVDEIVKLSILHEDRNVHPHKNAHCRRPAGEVFFCHNQPAQHVKDKLRECVLSILLMRAESGGSEPRRGTRVDLFLSETIYMLVGE